jgi:hypothetical protein
MGLRDSSGSTGGAAARLDAQGALRNARPAESPGLRGTADERDEERNGDSQEHGTEQPPS